MIKVNIQLVVLRVCSTGAFIAIVTIFLAKIL